MNVNVMKGILVLVKYVPILLNVILMTSLSMNAMESLVPHVLMTLEVITVNVAKEQLDMVPSLIHVLISMNVPQPKPLICTNVEQTPLVKTILQLRDLAYLTLVIHLNLVMAIVLIPIAILLNAI